MAEDEALASYLEALLTPAITSQQTFYRLLELRDRILDLPLMVAAVLTLLWQDVAGVQELTRLLAREGFLSVNPLDKLHIILNPHRWSPLQFLS